ncbi:MAG: hypothetical protein ABW168_16565, partial [Sedimenticola sp.]
MSSSGVSGASNICDILVDGCDAKALIDTGSGVCLISDRFRLSSPILRRKKLDSNISIDASSVNNEPVKLKGLLELDVRIGTLEISF